MSNLDLLTKAFQDHFPAQAGTASVEFVSVTEKSNGKFGVVIRLVIWDTNPETGVQSIRDVKEQEIGLKLPALDLATIGRMHELIRALVVVLSKALEHTALPDQVMPHDLVDFSPLKLVKATTEDDFVKALSMPSRLGRYLPNPA